MSVSRHVGPGPLHLDRLPATNGLRRIDPEIGHTDLKQATWPARRLLDAAVANRGPDRRLERLQRKMRLEIRRKKRATRVRETGKSLRTYCRRQDLNLHPKNADQPLKLARLPIPPLRHRAMDRALMLNHPDSRGAVSRRCSARAFTRIRSVDRGSGRPSSPA